MLGAWKVVDAKDADTGGRKSGQLLYPTEDELKPEGGGEQWDSPRSQSKRLEQR